MTATMTDTATMTVHEVVGAILAQAARTPGRVALTEAGGLSLTYGDLAADLDRLTADFRAAGMRPGDRVYFMVPPRIASVLTLLAILRVGAVVVAADPTVGDALFASRMALLPPRWLVAESGLLALTRFAPVRALLRRRGLALPNLPAVGKMGCGLIAVGPPLPGVPGDALRWSLRTGIPRPHSPSPLRGEGERGPGGEAPAFVVFTSGTTAQPKAVVHTAASIGASVGILAAHLALTPDDVVLTNELHLLVPALLAGARGVLRRERRFRPERWLADVRRYGATHTFALPSDFERVVAHLAARDERTPAHLRTVLFGSAPVERGFLARCRAAVPETTTVAGVYAMTEMLPVAAVTLDEKLAYTGDGDLVGMPFPGVRAHVAPDGELLLAGPHLFYGYAGGEPVREHATGDLARVDGAGRIVLLGRKKEMIIRGATNIYPALVESQVAAIPGVAACALVGVRDAARSDERVVLAVEPLPGTDTAALRARLGREMRSGPRSVATDSYPDTLLFMTLPRSGRSRKVDRRALAALLREQLP